MLAEYSSSINPEHERVRACARTPKPEHEHHQKHRAPSEHRASMCSDPSLPDGLMAPVGSHWLMSARIYLCHYWLLCYPFWQSYFIKLFNAGLLCEFIRTFYYMYIFLSVTSEQKKTFQLPNESIKDVLRTYKQPKAKTTIESSSLSCCHQTVHPEHNKMKAERK